MATINLGAIKFNWKGAYNSGTAYAVDDVVSSSGNSYVCIQAHTNQAVGNATAYWNIMSSAGTDGTDVGATLNNKEIAFKTNAGAVDGIPIGTAGQFLKVNSGATGYEYGAISSEIVKIAEVTTSSNASSVDFHGYFDDTTYYHYEVKARVSNSTNLQPRFRWLTASNTEHSASNYRGIHNYTYRHANSNTQGGGGWFGSNESDYARFNDWQSHSSRDYWLKVEFSKPTSSSNKKPFVLSMSNGNDNDSYLVSPILLTWESNVTTAFTGLRIYTSTGNFVDGSQFKLYGWKA